VFDCKNNEFYVKDSLGGRIKKIGEIGLREHLDNKMNKYYPGVIFSIDNTLL